jgi:hypothetical protein
MPRQQPAGRRQRSGSGVPDPLFEPRHEGEGDLTIEAGSLDNGTRDRHLRSERFFDVAAHPQVRFSSTLINEVDGTMADATVRRVGDDLEMEATTTVDQRELGLTFSRSE